MPAHVRPDHAALLALQRDAGNQAVLTLLRGRASHPRPSDVYVQRRAVSTRSAVLFNRSLLLTNQQVRVIQGVIGVKDDGLIGPMTVAALVRWQKAHNLTPDGRMTPATLTALARPDAGVPSATPAPTKPGAADSSAIGDLGEMLSEGWSYLKTAGMAAFGVISSTATADADAPGRTTPPPSALASLMQKERLTNEEIAQARTLIAAVRDESQQGALYETLQTKVEYRSQRDNASKAGGKSIGDVMCNLTSLAMCLSYLGVQNPKPAMQFEDVLEEVRVKEGLPARTQSAGWGGVAKKFGVQVDFVAPNEITEGKEWYLANVSPHLRKGHAVMASISGHIVRLQACTDQGLVADDPYGASRLLPGVKRGWEMTNKKGTSMGEGATAGEDVVWPWADVKRHTMRWVAAFSR